MFRRRLEKVGQNTSFGCASYALDVKSMEYPPFMGCHGGVVRLKNDVVSRLTPACMTKRYLFYFLLSLHIMVTGIGCKKGDTGPAGPQGQPGVVGAAGANGTVIYSGTATPDATLGAAGDFYLDLTTNVLYGPKNASGWGAGFSMKGDTGDTGATGATGAAGQAGTQIYSGSGAPASTLGTIGDFYMDTVAHNLYGPKLAAGWGLAIALQGPAGSANVQYTPWFTPYPWSQQTPYGIIEIYYNEAVPALTSAIVNGGTILVYGQLNDYITAIWPANEVAPLPISLTYVYSGKTYTDTWQYQLSPGNLYLQMTDDLNFFNGAQFVSSNFRIVIIPGGVPIPTGIGYKELKKYLGVDIPD